MKPIILLAALFFASPALATEELLSEDGTILKLENTEDAIATPLIPPAKLNPSAVEDVMEDINSDPFGRACSSSKVQKPSS
mgnify:CR=1 FL=1